MMLVNGLCAETVSASNRGLHYGDGVFETLAVLRGEALLLESHLARLRAGCRRLAIVGLDETRLCGEISELVRGLDLGVLKIIVTRGEAGRGYSPTGAGAPTRVLAAHAWPEYDSARAARGIRTRICDTRIGHNPATAGLKHLNRLEQVLARAEWCDHDIAEGFMLDADGNVVEGTMTNVFLVRGGRLLTPDLTLCGVTGIIREIVLEHAQSVTGSAPAVGAVSVADLFSAEEIFVCNSVVGIWPVGRIGDQNVPLGSVGRRVRETLLRCGAITHG